MIPRRLSALACGLLAAIAPLASRAAPDAVARVPEELKRLAVARVDSAAWGAGVRLLSGHDAFAWDGGEARIVSRYARSDGILLAGEWLLGRLAAAGYAARLDTFLYAFNGETILCRNVVAETRGRARPGQVVVLGAHYDSYAAGVDPSLLAPGAEDNATGAALVLEAAQALAGLAFARTVQFAFFSAEELGLWGSRHHVARLAASGDTVHAAVVADMVSWWQTAPGLMLDARADHAWLAALVQEELRAHTALADSVRLAPTTLTLIPSDHRSFADADLPALLLVDRGYRNYPGYHTIHDTWTAIAAKSGQGVAATRAAVAAVAELAGLRPEGLPVMAWGLRARPRGAGVELAWVTGALPPGAGLAVLRAAGGPWTPLTPTPLALPPGPAAWVDTAPAPAGAPRTYRLDLAGPGVAPATVAGPVTAPAPPAPGAAVTVTARSGAPGGPGAVAELACAAARPGPAALTLHDLAGRAVRDLWRGWLPPDGLSVAWDGRDDRGRRVAAGLYVARLAADGGAATARVVVLR